MQNDEVILPFDRPKKYVSFCNCAKNYPIEKSGCGFSGVLAVKFFLDLCRIRSEGSFFVLDLLQIVEIRNKTVTTVQNITRK